MDHCAREEKIIEITNGLTEELDAKHPQTHKQDFHRGEFLGSRLLLHVTI